MPDPQIPFNEVPMLDMNLIPDTDSAFSSVQGGFWMNPEMYDSNPTIVKGSIKRIDRFAGTMKVVGVDADMNIDVPIPSSMASGGFFGDASLPARDWQVVMVKTQNGDYHPVSYVRPYDQDQGWMRGVPEELEEGDIGWTTENSKVLMFQNGMLVFEASPNCVRHMHPLDNGEKITDIARTYGLFTDAGEFTADVYENSPLLVSRMQMKASSKFASEPEDSVTMTLGSLDLSGANIGFRAEVANGPTFEMKQAGKLAYISATKLSLGDEAATEPVVLGTKFLAEYKAFKAAFNAFVNTFNAHTHVTPSGPSDPPKPLGTTFNGTDDFLSATVFSK